jgi:acetyl esterase/lipase
LVVVIHGGAWRSGDPAQLPALNSYLAGRGFSVAAITYRLTPKHIFPAQIEDVEQMIAWLRAEAKTLQIDADRIALLGRSAGGHLALLAGYRKVAKGIRAVVDLYGPTDLHWSWANPSNPWVINSPQVLRAFLGGTPKDKKAAYDAASPLLFVDAQSPPTLLVQGGRDELVSFRQSRRLAERLKQHRVKHFLLEIPWATHGLDANLYGPSGQLYLYALERFLVATMRLSDQ